MYLNVVGTELQSSSEHPPAIQAPSIDQIPNVSILPQVPTTSEQSSNTTTSKFT